MSKRQHDKLYRLSTDIKYFFEPFCLNTGITYFHHIRVFNDRTAFILNNNPQYMRHFLQHKFAVSEPGTYTNPGIHLWAGLNSLRNFDNQALHMKKYFDIDHQISIVEPQADYIDIYTLGTTIQRPEMVNFYINNLDILDNLFLEYQDKFAHELETLNAAQILLPLRPKNSNQTKSENPRLDQITARELECLGLISQGKTAKMSAQTLNISPRTVERHIDNIRTKLKLKNKSELIYFYFEHACKQDIIHNSY